MAARIRSGEGYKSRPEYLPIQANLADVHPHVQAASGVEGDVQAFVLSESAELKVISVYASKLGKIGVQTFYYPAWFATIDDHPAEVETFAGEGTISIRVPAGTSKMKLKFGRTADRLWGGLVSAGSLVIVSVLLMCSSKCKSTREENERVF